LSGALVDIMELKAKRLADVKEPTEDTWREVQEALCFVTLEAPCRQIVQRALEEILSAIHGWVGSSDPKRYTTDGQERIKVPTQTLAGLRTTVPSLWIGAAHACPGLFRPICRVLCKWAGTFRSRDLLLEAGAAEIVGLADTADPFSVAELLFLAVRLSCGSEERVARLERQRLSVSAAAALRQFPHEKRVVAPALAYLNNVANCEEHWHTLEKVDAGSLATDALDRYRDMAMQGDAKHILDVLAQMHPQQSADPALPS
jgi:hypothetical protein